MYDLLNCPPSPIVCHPLNSLAYEKNRMTGHHCIKSEIPDNGSPIQPGSKAEGSAFCASSKLVVFCNPSMMSTPSRCVILFNQANRGQPAIENESLQVVKEANGWWQHFEVVRSNTKMAKML
uniref:Uncharacterized protein n=1 Tax=Leersia perrieri TaxID=77586 RepID=A0A0D9W3R4_9ORYZ